MLKGSRVSEIVDAKSLARSLRSTWQGRASKNTIRPTRSEASAVIYDSVRVQLTAGSEGIRLITRTTFPRLRVIDRNELVAPARLPDKLSEVDADVRTALPAGFIAAFDEWGRQGYPLVAMSNLGRSAESSLEPAQIGREIVEFWKGDVSDVRVDEAQRSISAVLHGCVPLTFSLGLRHGELNGAIATEDGFITSCFGTWLLADHSDATGLNRLCELIDHWARLRLDAPLRAYSSS